uniref:Uncharacterized protein n=1 Tax=Climaconeis cf. scalaris TaxID=2846828 RepID=A0A8F8X867_9STRA|nr:hypothetical protein [Climaconeis cf. scalaris]
MKNHKMQIKNIRFLDDINCINDALSEYIDVVIENYEGYHYTLTVTTPKFFVAKIEDERMNFTEPGTITIFINLLTEAIITRAIEARVGYNGYSLKLYQSTDAIDPSIFKKLEAEGLEEWKSWKEDKE